MRAMIVLAIAMISFSASASGNHPIISGMSDKDVAKVEKEILKQIGFEKVKDFKIDLNDDGIQCLEARSEMDEEQLFGTCMVEFGGFQVIGKAAISKTMDGYQATVVVVDVE